MSTDLRQVLHDTASAPSRPLDAAHLVTRARRQKIGLRSAAVAMSVVAVAATASVLPSLGADSGPRIADAPPSDLVTPPIAILDEPPPSDDAAARLAEQLELGQAAAASARVARRSPGWAYLVYTDTSATVDGEDRPDVCLAAVSETGPDVVQACGSREVPSRSHAVLVAHGSFGAAGILPDGITATHQATGVPLPDAPVVNNVFVDPASPSDAAMDGRSNAAFCAVVPRLGSDPETLADSDNPLGVLETMANAAPLAVADDMYLVWDYLRVRPDAFQAHTVTFDGPAEGAAERIDDHIRAMCPDHPGSGDQTEVSPAPA